MGNRIDIDRRERKETGKTCTLSAFSSGLIKSLNRIRLTYHSLPILCDSVVLHLSSRAQYAEVIKRFQRGCNVFRSVLHKVYKI